MYYLEYHELLKKYKDANREFNNALDKNGALLKSVSLKATQYQEVLINHTHVSSDYKLINYLSEIDEIRRLIDEGRNATREMDQELRKMEIKLKASDDVKDRIYYYKWIRKTSPYKFCKIIGYSVRQIYNYIDEMKEILYKN